MCSCPSFTHFDVGEASLTLLANGVTRSFLICSNDARASPVPSSQPVNTTIRPPQQLPPTSIHFYPPFRLTPSPNTPSFTRLHRRLVRCSTTSNLLVNTPTLSHNGQPQATRAVRQHAAPANVCCTTTHLSVGHLTFSSIPCNGCKIQKKQDQYSANRLADLQKHIIAARQGKRSFNPSSEGLVRCSLCVGGPAVEHQCFHCEITYPRNDRYFSKSMLKNRKDEAVCFLPLKLCVRQLTSIFGSSAGPALSANRTTLSAAATTKQAAAAVTPATQPSSPTSTETWM